MSLKTIAERAGVSISTVSRVLSGTAKISHDVRLRVIEAARDEGYIDSRTRSATRGVLKTLAVVAPSALLAPSDTNFVAWTIFNAMREIANKRSIELSPIMSEGEHLRLEDVAQPLKSTRCDATAVFFDETPEIVDYVASLERPMVLMAGQDPTMRVPSVGIGNRYGAHLGTEYLLQLGHSRIALLTWEGRNTIRQREDGYREAVRRVGRAESIISLSSFHPEVAERELLEKFDAGFLNEPTALFCLADNVALAAIRALNKRGARVPEDVSVLGFDDAIAGEMASPPLTTVHAPLKEIAQAALDELERQFLFASQDEPVRRVELSCKLIERASCAAPRLAE